MKPAAPSIILAICLGVAGANGNVGRHMQPPRASSTLSISSQAEKQDEANKPTTQVRDDAVVARVNCQRTGVYNTKAVRSLNGIIWKTSKLFSIESKTRTFDPEVGGIQDFFSISPYTSAPIFAGGMIYLSVYVGDGYLLVFDAKTGQRRWVFKRDHGVVFPPTVVGDTVYLGSEARTVVALNANTGSERWHFTTTPSAKQSKSLVSKLRAPLYAPSPISADGLLLFGTIDGDFCAVDLLKHDLKWSVQLGGVLAPPAIANGTAYFGGSLGFLYAIDLKTGQVNWKIKVRAPAPTVEDRVVYFGDKDNLYAVDATTSQQKWKAKIIGGVGTALAVAYGNIYVGGIDDSVYAIDAETGKERWRFKTKESCESPIVADGVVYLGSYEHFFALDAKSGQQIWAFDEKKTAFSSPAIADGVAYTITEGGYLYAIR